MLSLIPPPVFRPDHLTPAQKAGLAYQRKVGKVLQKWADDTGWLLMDSPWLTGPCQPDFLLISPSQCVLVVEVKLTQTDCTNQFNKYRLATGAKVCVQICRRLTAPATMHSLEDAFDTGVMLLWL